LCCVAIDEIDAIVPKRDGDQKNSKGVKSLTQFLTLIGGVNNVKKVYMIGATNHFNKIDEAFLRRLGDKFYVGNVNSAKRTNLLQNIKTV
jgi:SpoVK/Ycf46/Vps4 family AAA+-type ATPase